MKRALAAALAAACLASCNGTVPERNAPPEQRISAILIGGRIVLPSGETRDGRMFVNFEGQGDGESGSSEVYRLPVRGGENYLYLVEPGIYRLSPTRSIFGFYQPTLKVLIQGRTYRLPFPREILRLDAYRIKPTKIVTLGVLEARVYPALPGRAPEVKVRLDDSVAARRSVVQSLIRDMMDPEKPAETRESIIAWNQALQNSLMTILSEEDRARSYKPAE